MNREEDGCRFRGGSLPHYFKVDRSHRPSVVSGTLLPSHEIDWVIFAPAAFLGCGIQSPRKSVSLVVYG